MVGAQPMARSRKHSALAGASLALTVALLVSGVAAKAAALAPSAGGGGNVTGAVGDPRTGPHAREEARHAGQPLTLAPATTTASPLRLNASNPTVTRSRDANPRAAALLPSNPKLAREVFGFAPYWALSGNGNWDYSLLSTIAYFGLDVQSDGSFSTSATNNGFKGWMSQDLVNVINRAHASSDRVVLVIKAFDNATINAIVSNPNASQNAINWTIQSIRSRNLDGVNIDFEGSSSSSYPNLQSQFSAFVANLSNQVHAAIPGSVVSVDTYSGSASWDGGFMNITQLAPSVDSLFVMAYDMGFGNLTGHAAPNAPLNGWTYNDTTSVRQYIAKATASKVILGVPYFGYKYSTSGNLPYATSSGGAVADTYAVIADAFSCALQLSRNWDTTASSPWASWWSPASGDPCAGNHNSWRELYYDDATSLMAKYDLVNSSDLQGTGMWALGYDGTSPDLWRALGAKMRASWAATFDTSAVPLSWAVNQARTITIGLTNVGNSTWPAGGSNPVHLGLHFTMPPSKAYLTDQRVASPADSPPVRTATLAVSGIPPSATNDGVLQAQLVREQQFWFFQTGPMSVTDAAPAWDASYDLSQVPHLWTAGQTQTVAVAVTNTGNQTWPAGGSNPVHLGLHFAAGPGQPYAGWLTDQRVTLPADLPPGQSVTVNAALTSPAAGASVLEAQMVKEQQFWFVPAGAASIETASAGWLPGYDLTGVPRNWVAGQAQTVSLTVTNTGNQAWPAGGSNPVRLGLHFAGAPGVPYSAWLSDQRVSLPADLQPGQSVTLSAALAAPTTVDAVILEAQMVKEQQFWFVPRGPAAVTNAAATWMAGYDLSRTPVTWTPGQTQTFTVTVLNAGNQAWPSGGPNPVRLRLHLAANCG